MPLPKLWDNKTIQPIMISFSVYWTGLRSCLGNNLKKVWSDENICCTVGSKIIRALEIVLAIFLWFTCLFLLSHAVISSIKPKDHDLTNIYFIKIAYIYWEGKESKKKESTVLLLYIYVIKIDLTNVTSSLLTNRMHSSFVRCELL